MESPLRIRHRVNSVQGLRALPPGQGAEFDVRSRGSRLILNHEPHGPGDLLEDFLSAYAQERRRGLLVFNPKEDGLETEMLALARRYRVEDFFLLDCAFPTLVRLAVRERMPKLALRVSEYEPAAAALALKGKAEWVWLDCFTGKPPAKAAAARLGRSFKVCLVSPELQGFPKETISSFRPLAATVDAVCTKFPELWGA